jgi:hypothetical protein
MRRARQAKSRTCTGQKHTSILFISWHTRKTDPDQTQERIKTYQRGKAA